MDGVEILGILGSKLGVGIKKKNPSIAVKFKIP